MKTMEEVLGAHGVEIPAHLEAQAEVPVVTGAQRQGDVIVLPMRKGDVAGAKPVPAEGVAVVRGENGGNTHLLVAEGAVSFAAAPEREPQTLGTLVVDKNATAFLLHPEHGGQGIGPGNYTIRRQREQADEIRLVQD